MLNRMHNGKRMPRSLHVKKLATTLWGVRRPVVYWNSKFLFLSIKPSFANAWDFQIPRPSSSTTPITGLSLLLYLSLFGFCPEHAWTICHWMLNNPSINQAFFEFLKFCSKVWTELLREALTVCISLVCVCVARGKIVNIHVLSIDVY